ncbi:hypothetical protein TNIN_331041 [Trichonephila inaurata madagascariensis]|uniref:Uncharacterized protein n=1 Tax=Trichonephila inaurata madagascariensis TaxID=2747483 RepID=A0A8X7C902_9ARAC|nr:hypothetical protein TNIN_331041 [Trichonephila inaurata madagascariensis]
MDRESSKGNVQDEGSTTVELTEGCQVNAAQDTAMQEENRETPDIRLELIVDNLNRQVSQLHLHLVNKSEILEKCLEETKKVRAFLKAEREKLQAEYSSCMKERDLLKAELAKLEAQHSSGTRKRCFYIDECEKYKQKLLPEKIYSYLVNDNCICQEQANLHCCSNHNYCSDTCRSFDTSENDNYCLGILGQGVTIQRCSEEEMITELSSDSDQTETEDEPDHTETEEDHPETGEKPI